MRNLLSLSPAELFSHAAFDQRDPGGTRFGYFTVSPLPSSFDQVGRLVKVQLQGKRTCFGDGKRFGLLIFLLTVLKMPVRRAATTACAATAFATALRPFSATTALPSALPRATAEATACATTPRAACAPVIPAGDPSIAQRKSAPTNAPATATVTGCAYQWTRHCLLLFLFLWRMGGVVV